jgi:uncharacterized membrane protein HdeD (DUF308 family)
MTTTIATTDAEAADSFAGAARLWWVFLVIGIAWIVFAITILRFDWRSVSSISILFGVFALVAGIGEAITAFGGARSRWITGGRLLLAALCIIIGVVAFFQIGHTFAALAAVMSFYFVVIGVGEMIEAIVSRHEKDSWAPLFVLGLLQVGVGFWAAGDFGRRSILLVVWVGFAALGRGIAAIWFAFDLREFNSEPTAAA